MAAPNIQALAIPCPIKTNAGPGQMPLSPQPTPTSKQTKHFRRIGHPAKNQANAEDQARREGDDLGHWVTTCRMTNVVRKPEAMNAMTAARERGESRANPQTPWPLVQPAP
jgi:hypothetical protein